MKKLRALSPIAIAIALVAVPTTVFVTSCKVKKAPEQGATKALLGPLPLGIVDCNNTTIVPDSNDRRADVQTKLDDDKCLWLGCGTWRIGTSPGQGQQAIGSINMKGGMHLRGAGKCTVLKFIGTREGAWAGIRMYGRDNTIDNLTVDTSEMILGDEQTHVIEVVGNQQFNPDGDTPTDGNTIHAIRFNHPVVAGQLRGDCVRLLGEQNYPVTKTLIHSNLFTVCKRSSIGIQRGVYDWSILGNVFTQSTDQMIDGEQSGSAKNGRGIIAGNTFYATSGKFAIQLSGMETADLVIANDTIIGQGIQLYDVGRFAVTGTVITHAAPAAADATVVVFRSSGPGTISDNVIWRGAGVAGPVLSLNGQTTGTPPVPHYPANITITGNYLRQSTDSVGVNVLSSVDTLVSDNIIELDVGRTGPHAVKFARASVSDPLNENATVTGNLLRGPWQIGLTLQNTLRAMVNANSMDPTAGAKGLSCNSSVTGPVVSYGNNWTASSCALATGGNL